METVSLQPRALRLEQNRPATHRAMRPARPDDSVRTKVRERVRSTEIHRVDSSARGSGADDRAASNLGRGEDAPEPDHCDGHRRCGRCKPQASPAPNATHHDHMEALERSCSERARQAADGRMELAARRTAGEVIREQDALKGRQLAVDVG